MKSTLLEALLVATLGAVLAFTVNALSARGLRLGVDYFPSSIKAGSPLGQSTNPVVAAPKTNALDPLTLVAERVSREGFRLIDGPEATRLFHDPGYAQGSIVFVDARNDENYQAGHVPGAYQLDHYHMERYLPNVLPVCQQAQQIVVYCHGGDCEDSIFTAILLRDAGIPKDRLFIYGSGWSEWDTNGVPVELGSQKSGQLRPAKQ